MTMFLGERALAFRGSTQCVGDVHNGNFLGLLELISHDPILREHVTNVQKSHGKGKHLQAVVYCYFKKWGNGVITSTDSRDI